MQKVHNHCLSAGAWGTQAAAARVCSAGHTGARFLRAPAHHESHIY